MLVVLGLVPLSACGGYRFTRTGGSFGDVRRVAIEPLRNQSYQPGLEQMATEALLRQFQRGGGVRVVADPAAADLVLSGAVLPVVIRSRSFSSVGMALESEVELGLALVARRSDGQGIPLDPGLLRDWELYLASGDIEVERKNRDEALRRLCEVIAARVHDSLAHKLAAAQ